MILQDMLDMLNSNVDDIVPTAEAVKWLNAGKDKMAVTVDAVFPDIKVTSAMDDEFVFPAKFHEIPVLYASAMFKAQDTSIQEKNSFMQQFIEGLKDFAQKYTVPPQYRDDDNSEQFVAIDGQTEFTITKNSYDPRTGDLKVYLNGKLITNWSKGDRYSPNTFILDTPTGADDKVTAIWEIHDYLNEPPHSWWSW